MFTSQDQETPTADESLQAPAEPASKSPKIASSTAGQLPKNPLRFVLYNIQKRLLAFSLENTHTVTPFVARTGAAEAAEHQRRVWFTKKGKQVLALIKACAAQLVELHHTQNIFMAYDLLNTLLRDIEALNKRDQKAFFSKNWPIPETIYVLVFEQINLLFNLLIKGYSDTDEEIYTDRQRELRHEVLHEFGGRAEECIPFGSTVEHQFVTWLYQRAQSLPVSSIAFVQRVKSTPKQQLPKDVNAKQQAERQYLQSAHEHKAISMMRQAMFDARNCQLCDLRKVMSDWQRNKDSMFVVTADKQLQRCDLTEEQAGRFMDVQNFLKKASPGITQYVDMLQFLPAYATQYGIGAMGLEWAKQFQLLQKDNMPLYDKKRGIYVIDLSDNEHYKVWHFGFINGIQGGRFAERFEPILPFVSYCEFNNRASMAHGYDFFANAQVSVLGEHIIIDDALRTDIPTACKAIWPVFS